MSIFTNVYDTVTGWFSGTTSTNEPITRTTIPTPTTKPAPTSQPAPTSGGSIFSDWGTIFKDVTGAVSSGVQAYFGAKSQIEQLKTAQKIEEIKLKAVTAASQNAPAPAQIMLPSFSDWLNNPREAASMVTPAAIAGSGAIQGGMSILTIGLIGAGVFLLARR